MNHIALQHIQLFRALTRGFVKGAATQALDVVSGDIRQREQPQIENVAQYHHWGMEDYLARQLRQPIGPVLDACRAAVAEGGARIRLPYQEQEELGLYLKYLLQRRTAICKSIFCAKVQSGTPMLQLSADSLHTQNIAQGDCREEYLPLLLQNTCGHGLALPYTCVYTTRAIFDSSCCAVPLSPDCLLLFVHAPLHKYYCSGDALHLLHITSDTVLDVLNHDALQAELQMGGRYVIGGLKELQRLQCNLPGRRRAAQEEELQFG